MTVNETTSDLTFADLNLRPELLSTLSNLGYEEPTPVQTQSIPHLLAGSDLIGQAATGTGKTAAFALPLLQELKRDRTEKSPVALVLVPTRELAMQVCDAINRYGKELGVRVVPLYGGQPIPRQLDLLRRGVDIVVATPGRTIDHLKRRSLRLDQVISVVLDEADEMLDMGFAEDLETILQATPSDRQTMLFSATFPSRINNLAKKYLRQPVRIDIDRVKASRDEPALVKQSAYIVSRQFKSAAIARILDVETPAATLVFCRTRDHVDELTETLNNRGYRAEAIHGGMNQAQRDQVLNRLRNQTSDLLIATDVAARGLDIEHLTHVINYDVPASPETYTHRVGRVGRAGRGGSAITLAEPREHGMLRTIERSTNLKIEIRTLPTIADVHARRLVATEDKLRETLANGESGGFRTMIESLCDEFDVMQVALAAVAAFHESAGAINQEEIPDHHQGQRDSGRNRDRAKPGRKRRESGPRANRKASGPTQRIYVGVGRRAGIQPRDLVGAIANETSLNGRDIGEIDISTNFSLVEVPASAMNEVIGAIRQTTIKGKKVTVRRDRN